MERARLQYLADFLCHAFTDIGLMYDYQRLADAGRGALWLDLRYGHHFLNGRPVEGLVTPQRLQSELHMELGGDPATLLEEATLKVRFETEHHSEQRDPTVQWSQPTGRFVSCRVQCRSRVGVGKDIATGLHTETLEWAYPFHIPTLEELRARDGPSGPPTP